ncbi:Arabinose efflux permease [Rubrobacter radiotolerans]|uniref:Arabinose efflux permease n=1 Tax=Rubrobacter radiotolerans TaxID=42256 RepID=A0A023WZU7_RUBRA|nr:MFS transporter [Rubrobacter radiotolerans]AHY45339.1 Arabinose efflux permease [Rubrobacter radiotolerans]MDX5892750.1 MFS transporter [Rubrobacter radiotolerans]SMC02415.1 Predicted arabinose efflux permease, MFS family [Rubrobacter radiotolerans DSM 5868]
MSETLLTRPLLLVCGAAFATIFGFHLLLSVVPLYAERIGGGSVGAGGVTAVFMFATVATQVQMPRLLRRFGYRIALGAGSFLLGAPACLYLFAGTLPAVLAVTLARGVGFGIVTVAFAALVAELAPPGRRGEALGLLGVAITVPTVFCNPLGLWLAERSGFGPVFLLGASVPLLGLLSAASLGPIASRDDGAKGAGFFAGLLRPRLLRLALLFTTATAASGLVLTFLPLARGGTGLFSATGALLVVGLATTVSRWWAGRFADRRGAFPLLLPGMGLLSLGVALLAGTGYALLLGALVFGLGFGFMQSSTLLLTMERVSEKEYGLGSTVWNVAFDTGTGVGAFVFGFVIAATGFTSAFHLCAVGLLAAALIVPLDRRLSRREGG